MLLRLESSTSLLLLTPSPSPPGKHRLFFLFLALLFPPLWVCSTYNPFSLPRFLLSSCVDGPRNLTGTPPLEEPSTTALVSGFHSIRDRIARLSFGRLGSFLILGRGRIWKSRERCGGGGCVLGRSRLFPSGMVGGGEHSSMDHPDAERDLERGELRRDAPEFADGDDGDGEETEYFSDAEDRSWPSHSRQDSTAYYEDCISRCASARASSVDADADGEAAREHCRKSSCVSVGSLDDVDLEAGLSEIIKASPEKAEQNCRICHLGLESTAAESGAGITLGCSCKGDLSYAHRQCADTWFKIRGNKICEICSSTASNVVVLGDPELSDQWSETNSTTAVQGAPAETRRFWQGHRFLNFLLACMVFAFVISWLFHFNVPG